MTDRFRRMNDHHCASASNDLGKVRQCIVRRLDPSLGVSVQLPYAHSTSVEATHRLLNRNVALP